MNSVSDKGSEFIQDLSDAARKNPLSAALIGMGVLWLFAGSRPVAGVADFVRNTDLNGIPDAAGNLANTARSACDQALMRLVTVWRRPKTSSKTAW